MKFGRRFVFEAAVLSAALILVSCSTQGPTAPTENNQILDRSVVPVGETFCNVKLGAPASQIMSNGIPFEVSCEDMGTASMKITRSFTNRFGCPVWVEGSVKCGGTGNSYDFEMFILQAGPGCEVDGGFILISGPRLGYERMLRLPVSTRLSSVTRNVAN
ncbi:MAG: hypothetical protein HZB43_02020 [candidate division Zixibacteria bacterium]|nr:hypothetical protein [candidate division Zixibacteria bacterium]